MNPGPLQQQTLSDSVHNDILIGILAFGKNNLKRKFSAIGHLWSTSTNGQRGQKSCFIMAFRVMVKCRFEQDATEMEIYDADFPFQVTHIATSHPP